MSFADRASRHFRNQIPKAKESHERSLLTVVKQAESMIDEMANAPFVDFVEYDWNKGFSFRQVTGPSSTAAYMLVNEALLQVYGVTPKTNGEPGETTPSASVIYDEEDNVWYLKILTQNDYKPALVKQHVHSILAQLESSFEHQKNGNYLINSQPTIAMDETEFYQSLCTPEHPLIRYVNIDAPFTDSLGNHYTDIAPLHAVEEHLEKLPPAQQDTGREYLVHHHEVDPVAKETIAHVVGFSPNIGRHH